MNLGHFWNSHIDNLHNANRKKYRKLNLLYYVIPETQESDGGNFELWDKKVINPLKIPSKFNRLVVMETTKHSWHSVDHICSNIKRCCVSNYFFSNNSPKNYEYYHVTSFLGRPDERLKSVYGVLDNFLRNANLICLAEDLEKMKFHSPSIESILLSNNPLGIVYICDHSHGCCGSSTEKSCTNSTNGCTTNNDITASNSTDECCINITPECNTNYNTASNNTNNNE